MQVNCFTCKSRRYSEETNFSPILGWAGLMTRSCDLAVPNQMPYLLHPEDELNLKILWAVFFASAFYSAVTQMLSITTIFQLCRFSFSRVFILELLISRHSTLCMMPCGFFLEVSKVTIIIANIHVLLWCAGISMAQQWRKPRAHQ